MKSRTVALILSLSIGMGVPLLCWHPPSSPTFATTNTLSEKSSEPNPWSFLSTSTIGAFQFIKANPTYDGRGVVIIICDTGVDMGVHGLEKTSTGETKVIDAQDFSGEGDVELSKGEEKSEEGETFILHPGGRRLVDYDRLEKKPADGQYWIGFLDEERFKNSTVKDINNNGTEDDYFGVLAFEVKENEQRFWVAYVDTDADGHIDDERPLRDYKISYDTFHMRHRDKSMAKDFMTFALNIRSSEKVVSFHFADNPHGTHVAGIASGYRINNQETLNGIAPGAKVISLKIGAGTLAFGATTSGSMKKALDYGVNYAREHEVPVVFNFSYGIGSELEGRSDIDQLMDDILREDENIAICLSAGNEGPGISTVGTPAASCRAFTVGALLPLETARDIYGVSLPVHKIFVFSSRGGELDKPDVLAPGVASSTVPQYSSNDVSRGTSMASPQAAGAIALLMSAAIQHDPPLPYKGALIKRALKYSAEELPGYTYLDQGTGIIDVPRAFEILKRYAKVGEATKLLDYEITTLSPVYPDEEGATAYWRMGGYFPHGEEQQTFKVKAIFPKDVSPDQKAEFYRAFDLRSTHPWLRADRKSTYIKGEKAAIIGVSYDENLLQQPGLYVGKIVAYRKDGRKKLSKANTEFELLNTVIVPYTFHPGNDYRQRFRRRKLAPGNIARYFILVPPEASSAEVTLAPSGDKRCRVRPYIFDPAGRTYDVLGYVDSRSKKPVSTTIAKKDLQSGIWEVVVYAGLDNRFISSYDLTVSFCGLRVDPQQLNGFDFQIGEKPKGRFYVTNFFDEPFKGSANGKILGYKRESTKRISGDDTFIYTFKLNEDIERVVFDLSMAPESFNKFTDIAVNIFDIDGRALVQDALIYAKNTINFYNPGSGTYTYEVKGAFTYPDGDDWEFDLREYYYTRNKVSISVSKNGMAEFSLYPEVRTELNFTLSKSPSAAPVGFVDFGKIDFVDSLAGHLKVTVPVTLSTPWTAKRDAR